MDYNSLSGLDKAAILFKVLGEPLAVSFFSGVSKEKLMQVRVRSNELAGKIPTIIKKQILDEYSFMLLQDRYRKSKPDSEAIVRGGPAQFVAFTWGGETVTSIAVIIK